MKTIIRTVSRCIRPAWALGLTVLPLLAQAHTGVDAGQHHGWLAGLAHPFTGLDHLAAMLAVGLWSGSNAQSRADRLAAPVAFTTLLLLGAGMATLGLRLPAVEPMIAASLLVLGLLLSSQRRLPAVGAALAGGFALFHGAAHGTDLAGASAMAGMLAATVVLHGVGLLAGHRLAQHSVWWARGAGAVVAVMGGTLLLG